VQQAASPSSPSVYRAFPFVFVFFFTFPLLEGVVHALPSFLSSPLISVLPPFPRSRPSLPFMLLDIHVELICDCYTDSSLQMVRKKMNLRSPPRPALRRSPSRHCKVNARQQRAPKEGKSTARKGTVPAKKRKHEPVNLASKRKKFAEMSTFVQWKGPSERTQKHMASEIEKATALRESKNIRPRNRYTTSDIEEILEEIRKREEENSKATHSDSSPETKTVSVLENVVSSARLSNLSHFLGL